MTGVAPSGAGIQPFRSRRDGSALLEGTGSYGVGSSRFLRSRRLCVVEKARHAAPSRDFRASSTMAPSCHAYAPPQPGPESRD